MITHNAITLVGRAERKPGSEAEERDLRGHHRAHHRAAQRERVSRWKPRE